MKKYLFGLGAMLVGAGLMFVLMHGEVSADEEVKKVSCRKYKLTDFYSSVLYCKINDLTCVVVRGAPSCVKN